MENEDDMIDVTKNSIQTWNEDCVQSHHYFSRYSFYLVLDNKNFMRSRFLIYVLSLNLILKNK